MKLFTKYNRINLLATVSIFLLAGISFYFLLRFVVISQVDEDLQIEQHEMENYVAMYGKLPEIISVRDQHISYQPSPQAWRKLFHTIHSIDANERHKEPFRELRFYLMVNKQWMEIKVSKSLEGTDNMIQSIAVITLLMILLILVASVVINRVLLKKLWRPFYETLQGMREFELGKNRRPVFAETSIDEFKLMNETLRHATSKAEQDYRRLKEFTENASHELQTPLAIIQSKMDVLIQDEKLSETQSRAVQGAYEAIQRLARLNHALLLLTKIENGQFVDTASILLSKKVQDKLAQFEEMIAAKGLTLHSSIDEEATMNMNPVLADILFNNLFSNAIKYNLPGGEIDIIVEAGLIEISNTGAAVALSKDRLFRRFAGGGTSKDGLGLGLAIVWQVAEVSGLAASYTYEHEHHHFIIAQRNS